MTAADRVDRNQLFDLYADDPVAFYEDLGITVTATQRRIMTACQENNRVLALSANGVGKTAGVTMAAYHYWLFNVDALCMFTSGNFQILRDTSFPFLRTLHRQASGAFGVPGTVKKGPPRIEVDDRPQWWFKYVSPRDPENLEGRHGRRAFVVIEEADKPDVTEQHFASARSTASSEDDVLVALANPPSDRSNVVYDKMESDGWEVLQFTSYDSHNVIRETGTGVMLDGVEQPSESVGGLVDLSVIREDFREFNGRDAPDPSDVSRFVRYDPERGYWVPADDVSGIDPRWFKKRMGVMPPDGEGTLRPFYEQDVDAAVDRWRAVYGGRSGPADRHIRADQLGVDIARGGGDRTVIVARRDDGLLTTLSKDQVRDHERNKQLIRDADDRVDRHGPLVIDANGEGSGAADRMKRERANVHRYRGGEEPEQEEDYRNRLTEGYVALGDHLQTDAMVEPNSTLETELRVASRVLKLEERLLRGGEVLQLRGKDALSDPERLGRSPDVADAAMLACYFEPYNSDASVIDVGGIVG